jgi:hypothetical protein
LGKAAGVLPFPDATAVQRGVVNIIDKNNVCSAAPLCPAAATETQRDEFYNVNLSIPDFISPSTGVGLARAETAQSDGCSYETSLNPCIPGLP